MDNTICYLNTDLDLVCPDDLTELARVLEVGGVRALHVTRAEDAKWYSTFETAKQRAEPEASISQMLSVIESFAEPIRSLWTRCTLREFNIGYDCGAEPWAFNQKLSPGSLARLGAVGASLRITLYPDRDAAVCKSRQQ